jgi:D-inositol-3-phosphate glycosyltransferase
MRKVAVTSIAMLSLHTSPLAQPGVGDSGGMNVYVRELAGSLARAGVDVTVFVRRWRHDLPDVVEPEPGFRVVHIDAGAVDLAKEDLPDTIDGFADGVRAYLDGAGPVSVIHANYWLSGVAGHRLKHQLGLPLVSTFHTLARVKAETGDHEPEGRAQAEATVIGCSDRLLASCRAEADQLVELYGADPDRIELVPPGVDHAFFSPGFTPGDRTGARAALGLGPDPLVLFVGRIQPLKQADLAVAAVSRMRHTNANLVVVGGPSGSAGVGELARVRDVADQLGVGHRVRFVPPQPHHLLSSWYRAADVVVVPSRSESFGLVALEAAACGTPVVASAVGGLTTIVDSGRTGFLVDGTDPGIWAGHLDGLLDDPAMSRAMSDAAVIRARGYTWPTAAGRLRRMYADLAQRTPVVC